MMRQVILPSRRSRLKVHMAGSGSAQSSSVSLSISPQAGDLIVLWSYGSGTSFAAPGFTEITRTIDANRLLYKIATGSEGSSITGLSPSQNAIYVFRGNRPIKEVIPQSVNAINTPDNPSPQLVAASSGKAPLVVLAGYMCVAAGPIYQPVDLRTFVPAKDGEISSNPAFWLAYKIYNGPPSDVVVDTTVDMDDEGSNNRMVSCYLEIR